MKIYKKMLPLIIVLLTSSMIFSFEIYVRDMVGKSTTYAHTTVPLPSVVKADSDWVPLCKIDISTDTLENYLLREITVTIRSEAGFDYNIDIKEARVFYDNKNGEYNIAIATTTWDGSGTEKLIDVAPIVSTVSADVWKVNFKFGDKAPEISNPYKWYTFYFCIKTSSQIANNDEFVLRNLAEDIVLDINGIIETPSPLPSFTSLTADTIPPQLVAAYSLNPTSGTTLTVYNFDTYNIYTTTTDANNIDANNDINIKIKLTENNVSLSDNGIISLYDLIILDTSQIDSNNPSNIKSVSYLGSNEFRIDYTIIHTTVNSPTTAVPLKIKVRDAAGNETDWDDSFRCFIDRTKPATPVILSPPAGSWIAPEYPQLSWTEANDPNIFGYVLIFSTTDIIEDFITNFDRGRRFVGNTLFTTWGGPWGGGYPQSGTQQYYWGVAAVDKAGNISFSQPQTFRFDDIIPRFYNRIPDNVLLSYSTPTISVDVDDTEDNETLSGIDFTKTKLYVNNSEVVFSTVQVTVATTTIKYIPSNLPDGINTVKIELYDKVNNNISTTWSFSIDTTKPVSVDTDNDGYSDIDEQLSGTNPQDPYSYPAKPKGFWPLQESVLNANYFTATGGTITLRLDEVIVNNYCSGLDVSYTTASVDKIVVTHLTKGTTETWVYLPTRSWVGSSSATICIQLTRPFATNGSDDGEIQVKYKVKDIAGNISDWITKKFYYDTTPPVISTITVPTQTGSETPTEFKISVVDNIGVSGNIDAVQLVVWIGGNDYLYNMVLENNNVYTKTLTFSGVQEETIYYYFIAKDKANNEKVYPPNADTDPTYALPLNIIDQTPPKPTIYQIKTLQNYTVVGLTTTYTSTGVGNLGIKTQTPVVYQAPNDDYIFNIIRATVPSEAISVSFEYKLSTATQWSSIPASKTQETVGTNPVWEVSFNATQLPTNTYYDIRFVATDVAGNTYTPADLTDVGYARIYLSSPLKPKTKIDTANQLYVKDAGVVSQTKLLLNAIVSGYNRDVTKVKFQYKKSDETQWRDIAENDIPTGTTVTFILKEQELPYLQLMNSVFFSTFTEVKLDFISGVNYDNYDKQMTKVGNDWIAKVYFVDIGIYFYKFIFKTPEGDKELSSYDPRRYIDFSFNLISVSSLAYEWDLSTLQYGEYQLRAVAVDKFNQQDDSPETISISYVNAKPNKPVITQPFEGQKVKSGTSLQIKVAATDTYISSVLLQYSEDGQNWINYSIDDDKSNGWSYTFTIPQTLSEKEYYFRAISFTTPPDFSEPSDIVKIIVDPTVPQIKSFVVLDGTTTVSSLDSGKTYTLKVETLDNDISTVIFTLSTVSGVLSPNNGVIHSVSGGKGTVAEPYYYLCSFTPNNLDTTTGNITVTLFDIAGNSVSQTISVSVKDVTPSVARINKYRNTAVLDWSYPSDVSFNYIGIGTTQFEVTVSNLDGGTVKLQYSTSTVGVWNTISEQNSASPMDFYWTPNVDEGIYYLRVVATDNDNNIDPDPQVLPIIIDFTPPKVSEVSVSPTGIIDCSQPFSIYAKTDDADVKSMVLQYLDPSNNNWVTIDETTPNRLVALIKTNLTPNNVGLQQAQWDCIAHGITQATTLKFRVVPTDLAGNFSYKPEYSKQIDISFNDTSVPIASVYNLNSVDVYAQTADANIKNVLFQYRVVGDTNPWVNLGIQTAASSTYGNIGKIWRSPTNLTNLPAGTYQLRAIATDMFNNSDAEKAPVITVVIEVSATGHKTYYSQKSKDISLGIKDAVFDTNTISLTYEVVSEEELRSAPKLRFLVYDGFSTITKVVSTEGSGNTYTGSIKLENYLGATTDAGKIWVSVEAETVSGTTVSEVIPVSISQSSSSPSISNHNYVQVSYSGTPLSIPSSLLISKKVQPSVPQSQSSLLKPSGICYEILLSNNIKVLPQGSKLYIVMRYSDADILGLNENKLGIAYWDEEKQMWTAEGITDVSVNTTYNYIRFYTNHLSAFAIMEIDSVPEIDIESPKENSSSSVNPLISVKATDKFSGIAEIKIDINGVDYTDMIITNAASDGIDNNFDGRIDEKGGLDYELYDDEQAFNILSPTSARLVSRLLLNLKPGQHTLTVSARNQQGQTTTKTIRFYATNKLEFAKEPFNYPNPFNPRKTITKIVPNLTKDAEVTVNIYDFAGDKVATLGPKMVYSSGTGPTNIFEWNGTEDKTKKYLADGVYFAEISATDGTQSVRKFIKIAITSKE